MQIPIRTRATARSPVAHVSMARTGLSRPRRTFALAVAAAAASVAMPAAAFVQASSAPFPSNPMRVIVGFSPGSNSDSLVRPLAQRQSEMAGQQVLVVNRPVASGNIAMEMVSRAAPDGYTVFSGPSSSITVNPPIHPKMPIDVLRDLLPGASR
jgi:tripartite-type tricarboxylate transporter receptor subunit TctC